MALQCPRCSTVVSAAPGQQPVCPTCGYPGADRRQGAHAAPSPSGHPSATGTMPPAEGGPSKSNGLALGAILSATVGIILWPLGAIAAIVLGAFGLKEAKKTGAGKGMAGWGLGLGIAQIVVAPIILATVVFVLVQGLGDIPESPPDVSFTKSEADDQITVARSEAGVDWSDFEVRAAADGQVRVALNGPASRGTAVQDGGTALPPGPMEPGDVLSFCVLGPPSDAEINVIHTRSADLIGSFQFSTLQTC